MTSNIIFKSEYKWSKTYWIVLVPLGFLLVTLMVPQLWIVALIFNAPLVVALLLHKHYVITSSKELIVYRCLGLIKSTFFLSDIKGYAFLEYQKYHSFCLITASGNKIRVRGYEMANIEKFLLIVLRGIPHNKYEEIMMLLRGELRSNLFMFLWLVILSGWLTYGAWKEESMPWWGILFVLLMWGFVGFYVYEIIQTIIKFRIHKSNRD
ncbi:MAG: hypothetical protein U0U66_03625 [Cytophagaceae bacterium]